MNWSSLDGAQKRPQNGTDRRKGWGRALLPSSLRRLYGPLDGWSAETPKPLRPPSWHGTWNPLLAKSSSRVWRPDSHGGYPPRIAGGFLLPCSGAHCIQSISVSIALSMGQLCGRLHACRFRVTGSPTRITAPFFVPERQRRTPSWNTTIATD